MCPVGKWYSCSLSSSFLKLLLTFTGQPVLFDTFQKCQLPVEQHGISCYSLIQTLQNKGRVMQFKVFKERQYLLLDQLLQLGKKQTAFQAH